MESQILPPRPRTFSSTWRVGSTSSKCILTLKLPATCADNHHSLSSEIIAVRGDDGAFPALVHEHLLRERSHGLATLIEDARQAGENRLVITIGLVSTAMHRWCVWLYGQPLRKQSDDNDPDRAVVDLCEIFKFSMSAGDRNCANACIDAIRDIIAHDHNKLSVDLGTFLHFLTAEPKAVQMLVDVLMYGPCARSGKTWEWLGGTRAEEKWVHFFHKLGQTFAKRVADEVAGKEDAHLHPDSMAQHAYHITDKQSGTCCGLAADVVGDVSTSDIAASSKSCPILIHDL